MSILLHLSSGSRRQFVFNWDGTAIKGIFLFLPVIVYAAQNHRKEKHDVDHRSHPFTSLPPLSLRSEYLR